MISWPDIHFGPINLWSNPNMAEVKKKVESYIVTITCSTCGQGDMVSTDITLLSSPPKYPHVCNNCGDTVILLQRYPRQVYE